MVAYEHVERSNLSGDDRAFFTSNQTAFGGPDGRTNRCSPGTIQIGTTTYAIPGSGVTQATAGSLVAGTANRCDIQSRQDLFPQQTYAMRHEALGEVGIFLVPVAQERDGFLYQAVFN